MFGHKDDRNREKSQEPPKGNRQHTKKLTILSGFSILLLLIASVYGLNQASSFQNKIKELESDLFLLNYTINTQDELIGFFRNKSNECINDLYAEQWNNTLCQRKLYIKDVERPTFIKIAETVSEEHEYDAKNYNCQDFSKDLTNALNYYGYDANRIFGRFKDCDPEEDEFDCYHQWVRLNIFIESTTGEIIEPENYKENYEPIKVIG